MFQRTPGVPEILLGAAWGAHEHRVAQVSAERAHYESGRGHRWERSREQALARNRVCRYQGAQRWWHSLSPQERAARTQHYQDRYARLSLQEKEDLKGELARRRADSGVGEETLRKAWIASLPPQEYHERCVSRAIAFHALPRPLQVAYARSWEKHRIRWGINRDTPQRINHPPSNQTTNTINPIQPINEIEQLELQALADVLNRECLCPATHSLSPSGGQTTPCCCTLPSGGSGQVAVAASP